MCDIRGGTAKGRVREYREAARLDVIDAPILDQAPAMNVPTAVETSARCADHRWTLVAATHTPFVMFKADTCFALRLAVLVDQAWRASNRYLHNYWDDTAQFDEASEFAFSNLHHVLSPLWDGGQGTQAAQR